MNIELDAEQVLARFQRYVGVETTSDERATGYPSTACQWDLARLLRDELLALGLQDVTMDGYAYVTATLPATPGCEDAPIIGLLAHMDTSSEACGKDVRLERHADYDGGIIHRASGHDLDPAVFPELLAYKGQTILCSDGSTLLGADDKAGVTAIMTALEYLLAHPEVPHGKLRVGFTPDEETGRGTEHFDVARFGANFAYTIDGGPLGEFNYETFNATNATVVFHGVNVHTGTAKNMMRNAIQLAAEWQTSLPRAESPEHTEGYEGFYHSLRVSGTTAEVELNMLLRDHDKAKLKARKLLLKNLAAFMNVRYGAGTVELTLKDMYSNMREYVQPHPEVVQRALRAMQAQGVTPQVLPVRGGTDGSHLSEQGLPCPNVFTGGHNFHGAYEYIPLESLLACCRVVVELVAAQ